MLITEKYRAQQAELHQRSDGYGSASNKYAYLVENASQKYGLTQVLDYGAGKGRLEKRLSNHFRVTNYEPADPRWCEPPEKHDLVACIDVLEHIEPDLIDNVLDDLKRVTGVVGVFTISTHKAGKFLDDGRNAHLIIQPKEWWMPKLRERFNVVDSGPVKKGFYVICESLSQGMVSRG